MATYQDFTREENRDEFTRVQVDMVKNWAEGLRARGVDLEAHARSRRACYDRRWREALNHAAEGAAILDIGGGFLHESLLAMLQGGKYDYFQTDIDPAVVAANAGLAPKFGIPADHFFAADNTRLPFPSRTFDLVFSSHCVEHSLDLRKTFAEVRRVLKPSGTFFFAVPIGWDPAIEHLYFLDQDDWIALPADCGFRVHGTLVGDFYPESGHDVAVIATPDGDVQHRLDVDSFRKSRYELLPWSDPSIHLFGNWEKRSDCAVAVGEGDELVWDGGAATAITLVSSNDWSGIVEVTNSAGRKFSVDLFGWYPRVRPVRLLPAEGVRPALFRSVGPLRPRSLRPYVLEPLRVSRYYAGLALRRARSWASMRTVGRNPSSRGAQIALRGVLVSRS